jgi:23S rRNA-intervening sequence protein
MNQLPILQKTYDLVKWYVPILNHLPKHHKYLLGDRLIVNLYDFLECLVEAQFQREKLDTLIRLNRRLEVMRYQTRLLHDFQAMKMDRYEYVSKLINDIGTDLGGWIRQQKGNPNIKKTLLIDRPLFPEPQTTG